MEKYTVSPLIFASGKKIIKPPHLNIIYPTFSLIFAFMVFWSSCDHQQKQMYELHDNQLDKSKHY